MFYNWIIITVLVVIDEVVDVAGGYCGYMTAAGFEKVRYCPGKCCSSTYKGPVCCEQSYPSGAYVGAGVGTIIVLGVIILCTLYMCCKQKIMASYNRNNATRGQNVRRENPDTVPSVSASVDPILPPPYQSLPPPYYENQVEMGENSDETKDTDKKHPDYPPPQYTEYYYNETGS